MEPLKVIVLGFAGVGKSSLSLRFIKNEFPEEYEPTIENTYNKTVDVNGRTFQLDLLDTAGMDQSNALRVNYTKKQDCFILIYSVDDHESFEYIVHLHDEILRLTGKSTVNCILIANKADIEKREVPCEEGKSLSDTIHAQFFEVSAKTGLNVAEAMEAALKAATLNHPVPERKKRCYLF